MGFTEFLTIIFAVLFLIGLCKVNSRARKNIKKMWEGDKEW